MIKNFEDEYQEDFEEPSDNSSTKKSHDHKDRNSQLISNESLIKTQFSTQTTVMGSPLRLELNKSYASKKTFIINLQRSIVKSEDKPVVHSLKGNSLSINNSFQNYSQNYSLIKKGSENYNIKKPKCLLQSKVIQNKAINYRVDNKFESNRNKSTIKEQNFYIREHNKKHSEVSSSVYGGDSKQHIRSNIRQIITKGSSTRRLGVRPSSFKSQNVVDEQGPQVSAKCWAVLDGKTGELLHGRNENVQREVASITKVMTCYVALYLAKQWGLVLEDTFFEVSYLGASVGGTTASLRVGDQLTLKNLLFGMMLPSGNDAAVTIAENFGDYADDEEELSYEELKALNFYRSQKKGYHTHQMDFFISQMNYHAKRLGLTRTNYANPHGLANEHNKSTAYNVGLLCFHALKDISFQRIVSTKIYFAEIINENGFSKEVFWENTNKLLYNGFCGVKTGITNRSGPCVVEHYKDETMNVIIVLLNCDSLDERWSDAMKMVNWLKALTLN